MKCGWAGIDPAGFVLIVGGMSVGICFPGLGLQEVAEIHNKVTR